MSKVKELSDILRSKDDALARAITELRWYMDKTCNDKNCEPPYHWRGCPENGETKEIIAELNQAMGIQ